MYLDDHELTLALTTLRGQQFKLWLAAKAIGATSPEALTGRALAQFGLSSDVCAKYRNTVFLENASWLNYYDLYKRVVEGLGLQNSFWSISEIIAAEPTLRSKTIARCAMKYAEENNWVEDQEDMDILEMILAREQDKLGEGRE